MARKRSEPENESNGSPSAAVAVGGVPKLTVRVREDATATHEGEHYGPGEEFNVEGLTAVALAQAGGVDIVGSVVEE